MNKRGVIVLQGKSTPKTYVAKGVHTHVCICAYTFIYMCVQYIMKYKFFYPVSQFAFVLPYITSYGYFFDDLYCHKFYNNVKYL